MCVPIMHEDGRVMAVAQMINKFPLGAAFDEDDVHLFEDFAIHVSLAMSRVHFNDGGSGGSGGSKSTSTSRRSKSSKAKRKRRRNEGVEESEGEDLESSRGTKKSSKRSRKGAEEAVVVAEEGDSSSWSCSIQ